MNLCSCQRSSRKRQLRNTACISRLGFSGVIVFTATPVQGSRMTTTIHSLKDQPLPGNELAIGLHVRTLVIETNRQTRRVSSSARTRSATISERCALHSRSCCSSIYRQKLRSETMATDKPSLARYLKRLLVCNPGVVLGVRIFRLLRNRQRLRAALGARMFGLVHRPATFVGMQQQLGDLVAWRDRLVQHDACFHVEQVGNREAIRPVGLPALAVLIDLRVTQIEERERGIPRYSLALALALPAALPPRSEVMYLIDPDLPLPDLFDRLRSLGRIVRGAGGIAALPRVTHYLQCHLFDLSKNADVLFPPELARFRPRLCAVAYDLIPWLFKEHYLTNEYLMRRYRYHFELVRCLDRLLAISECTARDFVRLCQLDPERVMTIYGGIDLSRFPSLRRLANLHERDDGRVPTRHDLDLQSVAGADGYVSLTDAEGEIYRLRQPYWVYVGAEDFRKNLAGLIRGFAKTRAADLSAPPALVIVCRLSSARREECQELARSLGLTPGEDVVCTGYISDTELEICYRGAFGTVFPSIYEGLGLPVLESYHFGIPAISSDNSSLQELTVRECQFDISSETAMADVMIAMHRDPSLRERSLTFGDDILSRTWNWNVVARRVASYLTAGQA